MPTVTRIKATRDINTSALLEENKKKRVAAYARVSTDQDEQFTSFESQIQYYTDLIKSNPDYEYVEVYSDEGLSGTSVKKRAGFNRMIDDAMKGKIDLILVKSISRFGRNLLDIVGYIQTLKSFGVEVYFEKEGIRTFDKNVDISLAIMSAIAQEESHSISGNVTAGKRYKYARGEYSMCYSTFLGYKKGADGKPEIVPEEAELVRNIYSYFLRDRLNINQIATKLNSQQRFTKRGNKWTYSSVRSVLTNEKYKGDALLQKGYVKNYLDHVVVKNNGEVDQYYVEKGHAQIVSDENWAAVQAELLIRESKMVPFVENDDVFAGKLVCADCGSYYGRKLWHSTDKYKKFIYQCNSKYKKGKSKCTTPSLTEDEIKNAFVQAYNLFILNKEEVVDENEKIYLEIFDTSTIKEKRKELEEELHDQKALIDNLVESNNKKPMDEETFLRKYTRYKEKFSRIKAEIESLRKQEELMYGKAILMKKTYDEIKKTKQIVEFSAIVFTTFVEKVLVSADGTLEFHFAGNRVFAIKK